MPDATQPDTDPQDDTYDPIEDAMLDVDLEREERSIGADLDNDAWASALARLRPIHDAIRSHLASLAVSP